MHVPPSFSKAGKDIKKDNVEGCVSLECQSVKRYTFIEVRISAPEMMVGREIGAIAKYWRKWYSWVRGGSQSLRCFSKSKQQFLNCLRTAFRHSASFRFAEMHDDDMI